MQKTCKQCQSAFEVTDGDLAFHEKVSPVFDGKKEQIPPPTFCPDCRQQRRLAFRNERRLHRRTCDLTGVSIISAYAPDARCPVYESMAWWSDRWDPLSYGQDIDFHRPFFEQFDALRHAVPRIALVTVNNENAEYVNWSAYNKDSYLLFAADYDEACLYGTQIIHSQHCVDTLICTESAHCYDVTDCEKCHGLSYSKQCSNCSDSLFLSDCRACTDCILCTNLRNKRHCVRNTQLTPQEYVRVREEVMNGLQSGKLDAYWQEFLALDRQAIHRAAEIVNCENVEGNYLNSSRNLRHCFDLSYAEDCAYMYTGFKVKDLMDYCHVTEAELGYECMSVGFHSFGVSFAAGSWSSRDSLYVDSVHHCGNLFGCIGLRNKQHCILNKQYTKEQYEELVPKLIAHMRSTGEWGEYYPAQHSPFAYNETLGQEYFPMTEEQVLRRGWNWREESDEQLQVQHVIPASKLPLSIDSVPDDIINWAIECEATGRPFRIVKQELDFYRDCELPLPRFHPDERHRRRMALRNPRTLWSRECAKCKKPIQTTYPPERSETVYCEDCYLKEVY